MSDILLNAGTGEVEVVEFLVNDKYYAINVLKIKGIVTIEEVTPLPNSKEEIAGLTNIRGDMDIVIDLSYVLHGIHTSDYKKSLGLLCEFNETKVVFLVDRVEGIRRISWGDIKQSTNVRHDTMSIGTVMIDGAIILLLDFESITIQAGVGNTWESGTDTATVTPKEQRIVLAEDSRAIREMLRCVLEEAGYNNLKLFENGHDAKNYLFDVKEKLGVFSTGFMCNTSSAVGF